jgi:hypothetical protein
MQRSATLGAALIAACAAALAPALVSPAKAGGWHRYRDASPRYYRSAPRNYDGGVRYYNSPRAYRSACGYGDCACLRSIAIRTGNPVWWDKYQACTG